MNNARTVEGAPWWSQDQAFPIALSADGSLLACCQVDGVWLCDSTGGAPRRVDSAEADFLAFTRDGRLVISASQERGGTRILDPSTGKRTAIHVSHQKFDCLEALSADGRYALGKGTSWYVVDIANRRSSVLRTSRSPLATRDLSPPFAFSPDGSLLVGVSNWEYRSQVQHIRENEPMGRAIRVLDTRSLKKVSAFDHGWLEERVEVLYNMDASTWVPRRRNYVIDALAFSWDGKSLASVAEDGSVRLTDVASGEAAWVARDASHRFGAVACLPDGRVAVARLRFEKTTGMPEQRLDGVVVFDAQGRRVDEITVLGAGRLEALFATSPGRLHVLTRDGALGSATFRDLSSSPPPAESAYPARFPPAAARAEEEPAAPKPAAKVPKPLGAPRAVIPSGSRVASVSLSPDGSLLAYADGFEARAAVFDLATRKALPIACPASFVGFAQGDRLVVTHGTAVHQVDARTGVPIGSCSFGEAPPRPVRAVSSRGVVLGETYPQYVLFDPSTGRSRIWSAPSEHIFRGGPVAFSPDGSLLAGAVYGLGRNNGGPIVVVDVETLKIVQESDPGIVTYSDPDYYGDPYGGRTSDRPARVYALGFSPDGKKLAFVTEEGRVSLREIGGGTVWSATAFPVDSWPERLRRDPPDRPSRHQVDSRASLAIAADGRVAVARLQLWEEGGSGFFDPDAGVAIAKLRAGRSTGPDQALASVHVFDAGGRAIRTLEDPEMIGNGSLELLAFLSDSSKLHAVMLEGGSLLLRDLESFLR